MKVLITGGTGFVGQWMRRMQPKDLDCHYIGRAEYEAGAWKKQRYSYYVHLANIDPTEVIQAAEWWFARLLYCSSGIVYYPVESEYKQNKQAWERYCLDGDVNCVIARLFTFYGKYLDDGKAYTQFVKAAREGRPLEVWGDCTRSYMHGSELARRMWDLLLTGESGEVRDIGSTRPQTVKRLAQRISAFTGAPIKYVDKDVVMPYYVPKGKQ
jgi:nucleoside-diphosphate-sugar epimerase